MSILPQNHTDEVALLDCVQKFFSKHHVGKLLKQCNGTKEKGVSAVSNVPFCADKKVLPGFNSFKAKHSDLMDEWYTLNNYVLALPDQIGDSDQTPVWWICRNNPAHHYRMSVSTRLMFQHRERESCPMCKGLRIKLWHFV